MPEYEGSGWLNDISEAIPKEGKTATQHAKEVGMKPDVLRAFYKRFGYNVPKGKDTPLAIPDEIPPEILKSKDGLKQFIDIWTSLSFRSQDEVDRKGRYEQYITMDNVMPEAGMTLDAYADEAVGAGFIKRILDIKINNAAIQKKVKTTLEENDFITDLRGIIRSVCKYGDLGVHVRKVDEKIFLTYLTPNKWMAHVFPETNKIWKYRMLTADKNEQIIGSKAIIHTDDEDDKDYLYPHEFTTISIKDMEMMPYGRSTLENMRPLFDQLMTIEALLAMTRASKVERIIMKMPMKMSEPLSGFEKIVNARSIFKNMIQKQNEQRSTAGKIPALTDWLMFPSDTGYEIERMPAGTDQTSIEDIEYFRDKALLTTGLPKGYFTTDETTDRGNALVAQDLKFSRKIIPIQNAIVEGLTRLCFIIAAYHGANLNTLEVKVSLNLPIMINREQISGWGEVAQTLQTFAESIKVARPKDFLTQEGSELNILSSDGYFEAMREFGIPPYLVEIFEKAYQQEKKKNTKEKKKKPSTDDKGQDAGGSGGAGGGRGGGRRGFRRSSEEPESAILEALMKEDRVEYEFNASTDTVLVKLLEGYKKDGRLTNKTLNEAHSSLLNGEETGNLSVTETLRRRRKDVEREKESGGLMY